MTTPTAAPIPVASQALPATAPAALVEPTAKALAIVYLPTAPSTVGKPNSRSATMV